MTKQIRVAALNHEALGTSRVKVLFRENGFRHPHGKETAYWMNKETYHAFPLGVETTVDDYKKYGKVVGALSTDIYSNL